MTPDEPDQSEVTLEALEQMLATATAFISGSGPTVEEAAAASPGVMARLTGCEPVETAAAFAGLLTVPALQANTIRIEALIHFALVGATGQAKPSEGLVRNAFRDMGESIFGRMEDPAEDVFVGTVRSSRGNFRVLEGVWEGNAFYLQRFLNVVEAMPASGGYDELRDIIHALLSFSDLLCERSNLARHQLGDEQPRDQLDRHTLGSIRRQVRRVRFSVAELRAADIDPILLAPFLFNRTDLEVLRGERIGASTLERRPVIRTGDQLSLVLPTAVSAAIRYLVVEWIAAANMLPALRRGIAEEYAHHFTHTKLMGGRLGAPIKFQMTSHGALAGFATKADEGRYLSFVFFTDPLDDLDTTGLAGNRPNHDAYDALITRHVEQAYEAVSSQPDFIEGITMLVSCGIGRGGSAPLGEPCANCRVEFVSAYDLETLSWTPDFTPLSLWRLFDADDQVGGLGAVLQNINGLLNLVAWTRELDGHLVPHAALPESFAESGVGNWLMVNQNSQRLLRHQVLSSTDSRMVQDVDGRWIPVRHDSQSEFSDDRKAPLYGSEVMNAEGWLMSVYLAPERAWWGEASIPADTSGDLGYERWRMVAVWLSRAAPVLDTLPGLPPRAVRWRAVFDRVTGGVRPGTAEQFDYEGTRAAIFVSVDSDSHTVQTRTTSAFDNALHHEENIAERALIDAMIEGVLELGGLDQSSRPALLAQIVPNAMARQAHAFAVRDFRDFLHGTLGRSVVKVDQSDDAALRLGLGWRIRNRADGGDVTGKADTTTYLNSLVRWLEDSLCAQLKPFNREALLRRLLVNHELAAMDRHRWSRTSAAVLALHGDRSDTLKKFAEHDFALNAVFQASRILMEFGVCEAPETGGRTPGDLDLSRLMAKALLIFHLGGWSDAIRWDVMEPKLRITALGDVHANFGFVDQIINPHAHDTSDGRVGEGAARYADYLQQPRPRASLQDVIDGDFLSAWRRQFGTDLQDMRVLIDWLENRGIDRGEAVMRMTREDFVDVQAEGLELANETIDKLLDTLSLSPRASWRDLPEGFEERDRQPWRFRRRLSPMRRPILATSTREGAVFLVAPGMLRDVFAYMIANYLRGDFPPYQLAPEMRSWAARQGDARGAEFTREVSDTLKGLGWATQIEVKITKILGRSLDKDYGDVDVLAWHQQSGRILIVECKDVQYKKTIGEIAEQLADFRGALRPNGKPDYLLRHLERVRILRTYRDEVSRYLGVPAGDLESHLVFRNPVPIVYAIDRLAERVTVSILNDVREWLPT